jgi:hypothetical protein
VTDLQSDLAIRPLAGVEELGLFCKLSYTLDEELADDLAGGRRRPEWMWVALRGDRLVARAAFWGQRDNVSPFLLDFLDVADDADRVEVGAQLLRVALGAVFPDGSPVGVPPLHPTGLERARRLTPRRRRPNGDRRSDRSAALRRAASFRVAASHTRRRADGSRCISPDRR